MVSASIILVSDFSTLSNNPEEVCWFLDQASIGIAGRFKLSNRISINADYFIPIGDRKDNYKNSLAIGIDYETGGHVFQVMLANSQGPYEYTFIENANGDFSSGILYLGFNISRSFTLKGEDEKSW